MNNDTDPIFPFTRKGCVIMLISAVVAVYIYIKLFVIIVGVFK